MAGKHTFVVAATLAVAAVLGVVALGRTLGLGAASNQASAALIAKRTQQLDRLEASLRRQLASAPAAPSAGGATPLPSSRTQRVVYVRPQPIVVHKHRAGGESEHESGDQEQGGMDD